MTVATPRPETAILRLDAALQVAAAHGQRELVDRLLDMRFEYCYRATNWHADGMGLNPDEPAWWKPMEQRRPLTADEDARLTAWSERLHQPSR